MTIDKAKLKELAEAFPDYDYDSNTEPFFNGPSGESLGGGSTGFYCVYGPAFEIDGDQYDGVTLVESCPLDEAKFICIAKAGILSLLTEIDGLKAQHGRDSSELRRLCQARSEASRERDQLKAQVESLRAKAQDAISGQMHLINERDLLRLEVEELRMDAERYRWLRSSENQTIFTLDARIDDYIECLPSIVEQDLDAAVDSEMSK